MGVRRPDLLRAAARALRPRPAPVHPPPGRAAPPPPGPGRSRGRARRRRPRGRLRHLPRRRRPGRPPGSGHPVQPGGHRGRPGRADHRAGRTVAGGRRCRRGGASFPAVTVGLADPSAGDTRDMGARLQAEEVKERSQDALERAAGSRWLERLARAGLATRGLLYLVVALLVVQVARGHRETRADKQGALRTVVHQPLGKVLVLILAVGFAGYALWRFVEAAVGPPDEDDPRKATVKRIGYAARGVLYAGFFASAVKLLVWSNTSN